jgi:hypothetical protein
VAYVLFASQGAKLRLDGWNSGRWSRGQPLAAGLDERRRELARRGAAQRRRRPRDHQRRAAQQREELLKAQRRAAQHRAGEEARAARRPAGRDARALLGGGEACFPDATRPKVHGRRGVAGAYMPPPYDAAEVAVAKLTNGSLVISARMCQNRSDTRTCREEACRVFARSDNGGETWGRLWHVDYTRCCPRRTASWG